MGEVHVHEFMSADGVIDAPTWTFDYGFDPQMGEAIGAVTQRCRGILLGRTTYQQFEPGSKPVRQPPDWGERPVSRGRLGGRRVLHDADLLSAAHAGCSLERQALVDRAEPEPELVQGLPRRR